MSIDIKLQNACDHKINWVRSELQSDRKSIYLYYPVSSYASFKLRVNNVVLSKTQYGFAKKGITSVVDPEMYVLLHSKCKLNAPIIETCYTTLVDHCPKCAGMRYIDDVTYSNKGDANTLKDEYLLVQNVEKRVITQIGTNTYHTQMGTSLTSLLNQKLIDTSMLRSQITDQIVTSLTRFKQDQQGLISSRRSVSDGELLDKLGDVSVAVSPDDPTILAVTVTFTAKSGKTLEYTQFLEQTRQRVGMI